MVIPTCDGICEVARYTSIFSQLGLGLGGLVALIALPLTGLGTLSHHRNQEFRKLYDEFWHDDHAADARMLVSYDDLYANGLRPALVWINLRAKLKIDSLITPEAIADAGLPPGFQLTKEDLRRIESLDVFLSKLAQIEFLSPAAPWSKKAKRMRDLFSSYWIKQIRRRRELVIYIRSEWPMLDSFVLGDALSTDQNKPGKTKG